MDGGRSRSTWRQPMQTQGEHINSTKKGTQPTNGFKQWALVLSGDRAKIYSKDIY